MDDQALATAQQIDHQLRALRYERDRLVAMAGMARNIQAIDERIKRLEEKRAEIVEGPPKSEGTA